MKISKEALKEIIREEIEAFADKKCIFSIIYAPNQKRWAKNYKYHNSWNGIECLSRDYDKFYNPSWEKDDKLNGPYIANLKILKKENQHL